MTLLPSKPFTLVSELLVLFVVLPLILAGNPIIALNFVIIGIALIYIFYVSKRIWLCATYKEMATRIVSAFRDTALLSYKQWPRILTMFALFAVITTVYMQFFMPAQSFIVLLNKPFIWLAICFVYVLLSVVPQEFIYRVFFFRRYSQLGLPRWLFILLNAILFSLAHLMFFDFLVIVLTFLGGLLFAYNYQQSKSYMMICIEHSLYGLWLFTVGMGSMLAFPGA